MQVCSSGPRRCALEPVLVSGRVSVPPRRRRDEARAQVARGLVRGVACAVAAVAVSELWRPVRAQLPAERSAPVVRSTSADTAAPDLVLQRLRGAAAAANPAVATARAALTAARARAGATGFARPAYVSTGFAEAPNGRIDQGNVRLEVGGELFTGGRRRAARGVADVGVQAAEAALGAAARQADAVTVRAAVRATGSAAVAARLAGEDALLAGAEDGVRARFAVGDARYVDVLRLRTERLRVQTERAVALAEARAGIATLRGLLGDSAATLLPLPSSITTAFADRWRTLLPEPPAADSLVALAGDVQRAAAAVTRAQAERTLAAAERRPQVDGVAGVQRIGQANQGAAFGPTLGLTVSLPFTAARANRLGAEAADRAVLAAEASRAATVTAVRARIAAAAERYAAARERLAVFDAALLRGAREERESALASYRTRGLSLLELLDFERALARAEIDRVRALVDAADAYADLVTGGASGADLMPGADSDMPTFGPPSSSDRR